MKTLYKILFLILNSQILLAQSGLQICKQERWQGIYLGIESYFEIKADSMLRAENIAIKVQGRAKYQKLGKNRLEVAAIGYPNDSITIQAGLVRSKDTLWLASSKHVIRCVPNALAMLDAPISAEGCQYINQCKGIKVVLQDSFGFYMSLQVLQYTLYLSAPNQDAMEYHGTEGAFDSDLKKKLHNLEHGALVQILDIKARMPFCRFGNTINGIAVARGVFCDAALSAMVANKS